MGNVTVSGLFFVLGGYHAAAAVSFLLSPPFGSTPNPPFNPPFPPFPLPPLPPCPPAPPQNPLPSQDLHDLVASRRAAMTAPGADAGADEYAEDEDMVGAEMGDDYDEEAMTEQR